MKSLALIALAAIAAIVTACAGQSIPSTSSTRGALTPAYCPRLTAGRRTDVSNCHTSTPTPNDPVIFNWIANFADFNNVPNDPVWQDRNAAGNIVQTISRENSCNGSMIPDTSINGSTNHADQISNVFQVFADVGSIIQPIGWEYQTYGGAEYFQLAGNFSLGVGGTVGFVSVTASAGTSVGPIVPFSGSFYKALSVIVAADRFAMSQLPPPWNAITPNTTFRASECYK